MLLGDCPKRLLKFILFKLQNAAAKMDFLNLLLPPMLVYCNQYRSHGSLINSFKGKIYHFICIINFLSFGTILYYFGNY